MNVEEQKLNQEIFKDVDVCRCGARYGVYMARDERGWWYVCDSCGLPIKDSYHLHEYRHSVFYDDFED